MSQVVKATLLRFVTEEREDERRARELTALFSNIDASLAAQPAQPIERGWRVEMYDERFNMSALGQAIAKQDK